MKMIRDRNCNAAAYWASLMSNEKFSWSGANANQMRGFFLLGLKSLCQALSKAGHGAEHMLCPFLPDKSSPDLVI